MQATCGSGLVKVVSLRVPCSDDLAGYNCLFREVIGVLWPARYPACKHCKNVYGLSTPDRSSTTNASSDALIRGLDFMLYQIRTLCVVKFHSYRYRFERGGAPNGPSMLSMSTISRESENSFLPCSPIQLSPSGCFPSFAYLVSQLFPPPV